MEKENTAVAVFSQKYKIEEWGRFLVNALTFVG